MVALECELPLSGRLSPPAECSMSFMSSSSHVDRVSSHVDMVSSHDELGSEPCSLGAGVGASESPSCRKRKLSGPDSDDSLEDASNESDEALMNTECRLICSNDVDNEGATDRKRRRLDTISFQHENSDCVEREIEVRDEECVEKDANDHIEGSFSSVNGVTTFHNELSKSQVHCEYAEHEGFTAERGNIEMDEDTQDGFQSENGFTGSVIANEAQESFNECEIDVNESERAATACDSTQSFSGILNSGNLKESCSDNSEHLKKPDSCCEPSDNPEQSYYEQSNSPQPSYSGCSNTPQQSYTENLDTPEPSYSESLIAPEQSYADVSTTLEQAYSETVRTSEQSLFETSEHPEPSTSEASDYPEESVSDFSEDPDQSDYLVHRPPRISPFLNTPKQRKEERRKILKMSIHKMRAVEDPEHFLRRSVLINNTMKRLQRELREEKLKRGGGYSLYKRGASLHYDVLNNSYLLQDEPFAVGESDRITDDMTDALVTRLETTPVVTPTPPPSPSLPSSTSFDLPQPTSSTPSTSSPCLSTSCPVVSSTTSHTDDAIMTTPPVLRETTVSTSCSTESQREKQLFADMDTVFNNLIRALGDS